MTFDEARALAARCAEDYSNEQRYRAFEAKVRTANLAWEEIQRRVYRHLYDSEWIRRLHGRYLVSRYHAVGGGPRIPLSHRCGYAFVVLSRPFRRLWSAARSFLYDLEYYISERRARP